jgi:hypothetical protein
MEQRHNGHDQRTFGQRFQVGSVDGGFETFRKVPGLDFGNAFLKGQLTVPSIEVLYALP